MVGKCDGIEIGAAFKATGGSPQRSLWEKGTAGTARGETGKIRGLRHIQRFQSLGGTLNIEQAQHQGTHRGGRRGDARRMREGVMTLNMKIQLVQKGKILDLSHQKLLHFLLKFVVRLPVETESKTKTIRFLEKDGSLGATLLQSEADRWVLWKLNPFLFSPVLHQGDIRGALPFHATMKIFRQFAIKSFFDSYLFHRGCYQ